MTSSSDEPDWTLLPERPDRFFRLTAPYDLVDLKRAYNRLIQRFKPERYSDQFQQIRGAYESLERTLREPNRFGLPRIPDLGTLDRFAEEMTGDDPDRYTDPRANARPTEDPEQGVSAPLLEFPWTAGVWQTDQSGSLDALSLEEQFDLSKLDDVLASMREDASKTAEDYRSLALRVDNRPFQSREFLKVLLEGLERWPANDELGALCGEYFWFGPAGDELRAALVFASCKVPSARFFEWSSPGWRRLVKELPAPEFTRVFDECDARRPISEFDDRSNLVLQILAQLMWADVAEWINTELSRFDAQIVDRNPTQAASLHQLEVLWSYVQDATRRLDRSVARCRFEELIRNLFEHRRRSFCDQFWQFHREVSSDESTWIDGPAFDSRCDLGPTLDMYVLMDWSAEQQMFSLGRDLMDDERLIFALSLDDGPVGLGLREHAINWLDATEARLDKLSSRGLPHVVLVLFLIMAIGAPVMSWMVNSVTDLVDAGGRWSKWIGGISILLVFAVMLMRRWWRRNGTDRGVGVDADWPPDQHHRYKAVFRERFLARAAALKWGYQTTRQQLERVKDRVPERTRQMIDMWFRDFGAAMVLTARLYATNSSPAS
jgi:hypothetical protein